MRMKKTLAAASALAIAFALASLPQANAASVINPGPAIHAEGLAQVAKAKKHRYAHMHMHKHMGRMARSKRKLRREHVLQPKGPSLRGRAR